MELISEETTNGEPQNLSGPPCHQCQLSWCLHQILQLVHKQHCMQAMKAVSKSTKCSENPGCHMVTGFWSHSTCWESHLF